MIHEEDLDTVIAEHREKLTFFTGQTEYGSGFVDGLQFALRRLEWLKEGLYERARLEKEKP